MASMEGFRYLSYSDLVRRARTASPGWASRFGLLMFRLRDVEDHERRQVIEEAVQMTVPVDRWIDEAFAVRDVLCNRYIEVGVSGDSTQFFSGVFPTVLLDLLITRMETKSAVDMPQEPDAHQWAEAGSVSPASPKTPKAMAPIKTTNTFACTNCDDLVCFGNCSLDDDLYSAPTSTSVTTQAQTGPGSLEAGATTARKSDIAASEQPRSNTQKFSQDVSRPLAPATIETKPLADSFSSWKGKEATASPYVSPSPSNKVPVVKMPTSSIRREPPQASRSAARSRSPRVRASDPNATDNSSPMGDEIIMRRLFYPDAARTWFKTWTELRDIQDAYAAEQHPVFALFAQAASLAKGSRAQTAGYILKRYKEFEARSGHTYILDIPRRSNQAQTKHFDADYLVRSLYYIFENVSTGMDAKDRDHARRIEYTKEKEIEERIEKLMEPFVSAN